MPKVSRKIRACTECQKQKVKCDTDNEGAACLRCLRYGLTCVFYRSIQTIFEEQMEWKADIEFRLSRLEHITDGATAQLESTGMVQYAGNGFRRDASCVEGSIKSRVSDHDQPIPASILSSTKTPIADEQYQQSQPDLSNNSFPVQSTQSPSIVYSGLSQGQIGLNTSDKDELMTEPMGSLFEVTRLNKFRSRPQQGSVTSPKYNAMTDDFIARGVISVYEAEELLGLFTKSLNHYLWVGLDDRHGSVDLIRHSSPLLTASIMTAMSMHVPNRTETHDKCYKEFLSLVSQSMVSHTHNLDDIRGLTIAAFWLSDLSWKLSGHAVRIATELELHRSYPKASDSAEHHENARIWYMLYVCDHHFANAYGRPPMVHDSQQIIEHEQFLQAPYSTALDRRLLSQVSLFMILRRVYEEFDGRAISPFSLEMATKIRHHNLSLDQWRLLWEPRQEPNPFIGSFPSQGNVLYYNFAKLQINMLSLHRAPFDHTTREFTTLAVVAASNIINMILDDDSIRCSLVGTPLYVHTMLTFACVFLFKAATKWRAVVGGASMLDIGSIYTLISRVIDTLNNSDAGERHVIYRIASGLEKMITEYQARQRVANSQVPEDSQVNIGAWGCEGNESPRRNMQAGQLYDWGEPGDMFSDFGPGFSMGINQFLNTQISFNGGL